MDWKSMAGILSVSRSAPAAGLHPGRVEHVNSPSTERPMQAHPFPCVAPNCLKDASITGAPDDYPERPRVNPEGAHLGKRCAGLTKKVRLEPRRHETANAHPGQVDFARF